MKQVALPPSDQMREMAEKLSMEVIEEPPSPSLPNTFFESIPYAFAKRQMILPLGEDELGIVAAVADPLNITAIEELELLLERPVRGVYCPRDLLMVSIQETYRQLQAESDPLSDLTQEEEEGQGACYDLLDQKHQPPLVRLVNAILTEAIEQNASDIHFEPLENDLQVRFRVDGVMHTHRSPSHEYQAQLLARIKVMAKLDIAEHRLPQDGRIKLRMGGREIDFRVSTIPTAHGERIVLRILDKQNVLLGLEHLYMSEQIVTGLQKLIQVPEGIVLVTGPTGSGKTTTLYSALSELECDKLNIMTIEDPVEYKLEGIAQIQVKPKIGLTFAAGLRHILRQDPDVVMVGEIRDRETAEIAIQAALTGHLVFSTLHTNDAPSALTRLIDMGIESYLLSSSVVGILAQRLVRRICPQCRVGYRPSPEECRDLGHEVKILYRGLGCEACFGSGYRGRIGLYELMPMTHSLKHQVVQSGDAHTLRQFAIDEGMSSLAEAGKCHVISGATTVAELMRVTRSAQEV